LRPLAVTSAQPSSLAPNLPTISAAGVAGYEADGTHAVFVRAGTADTIISRLHQEIVRVLGNPDLQSKLAAAGVESVGSTPAQLAQIVLADIQKWGKLIKAGGIRNE
jgi:tripartite-type tricarboxylate transporter receptor subunit TctC